jgi:hypothetical protein
LLHNARRDILAANRHGSALFSAVFDTPVLPVNHARFLFLDSRARGFYMDWDLMAEYAVALLRGEAGRNPHDQRCST